MLLVMCTPTEPSPRRRDRALDVANTPPGSARIARYRRRQSVGEPDPEAETEANEEPEATTPHSSSRKARYRRRLWLGAPEPEPKPQPEADLEEP